MLSVPQPTKLQFDLAGTRHLICVEAKEIDIVYNRLEELKHIPQNLQILLLEEAEIKSKNFNIEQFDAVGSLKARLKEILDRAIMGMRFYAIGSEQFVWNLRGYARNFGLSEAEINLEVISRDAKNIYCSNCQSINALVKDNIFVCYNCGIKLEVMEHFSRLKNAYLGICADAESLKEPLIK